MNISRNKRLIFKLLEITAVLSALVLSAACTKSESEGFTTPEIVSSEATVEQFDVVLRCTLSSQRAERCGFVYGVAGSPPETVFCTLNGSSFEYHLNDLTPGATYTWYAFASAGESEIKSESELLVIETIPSAELHYITVSGRIILPNTDAVFGDIVGSCNVPIISNEYNENGGVITFDGTLTRIGSELFCLKEDLKEVTIPEGVRELGYSCFRENLNLRKLTILPGLTRVGDSSFHNCQGLSEIYLPDTILSIEKDAFSHCFSLREINLPRHLERLEQSAFLNCRSLNSIVIPETIEYIGFRAFDNDKSLKRIVCMAKEPPLGSNNMFANTGNAPIYVPAESVEKYRTAQYWSEYADRIFSLNEMSE